MTNTKRFINIPHPNKPIIFKQNNNIDFQSFFGGQNIQGIEKLIANNSATKEKSNTMLKKSIKGCIVQGLFSIITMKTKKKQVINGC